MLQLRKWYLGRNGDQSECEGCVLGPHYALKTTSSDFVLIMTVGSGWQSKRKAAEGYIDEAN